MHNEAGQDERPLASLARLVGASSVARLSTSHVVVVGIGGVGSWAAEALARSGVGQLTLIDLDHISPSNLNRQVHALRATLGQSKVLAMRERLLSIHPTLVVHTVDDFVTPDNWPSLVQGQAIDAVIDCCDQFSAKLTLARWAKAQRKGVLHYICVGAAGGKRRAEAVDVADLAAVTHDPLLAKLRYQLRREMRSVANRSSKDSQQTLGITCVFSAEAVAKPKGQGQLGNGAALNCAGYGSLVTVTAVFGMVAANCVIDGVTSAVRPKIQL